MDQPQKLKPTWPYILKFKSDEELTTKFSHTLDMVNFSRSYGGYNSFAKGKKVIFKVYDSTTEELVFEGDACEMYDKFEEELKKDPRSRIYKS